MQSFLPIQKQECLFLLIDNIICEVGIVQLLFETQIALINCEVYFFFNFASTKFDILWI